jgi:hypothetical protein
MLTKFAYETLNQKWKKVTYSKTLQFSVQVQMRSDWDVTLCIVYQKLTVVSDEPRSLRSACGLLLFLFLCWGR